MVARMLLFLMRITCPLPLIHIELSTIPKPKEEAMKTRHTGQQIVRPLKELGISVNIGELHHTQRLDIAREKVPRPYRA
jgi:hypothetical protein